MKISFLFWMDVCDIITHNDIWITKLSIILSDCFMMTKKNSAKFNSNKFLTFLNGIYSIWKHWSKLISVITVSAKLSYLANSWARLVSSSSAWQRSSGKSSSTPGQRLQSGLTSKYEKRSRHLVAKTAVCCLFVFVVFFCDHPVHSIHSGMTTSDFSF